MTELLVLAWLRLAVPRETPTVLAEPVLSRCTGGNPPSLEQLERRYRARITGPDVTDGSWHNGIVRLRAERAAVGFV